MKRVLLVVFCVVAVFCSYVYYKATTSDFKPTIISNFEKHIKENLKSPSSYKFISASCINDSSEATFFIEYEASNSFGALIKNHALYTLIPIDNRGNELEEYSHERVHERGSIPIEDFYITKTSFDINGEFSSIFNLRGQPISGEFVFKNGEARRKAIYSGHNIKYSCGDGKTCTSRDIKLSPSGYYEFKPLTTNDKIKMVIKNIFNRDL